MPTEYLNQVVDRDPQTVRGVMNKIQTVVAGSMITHPMVMNTQAEMRDRVQVCVHHIQMALNDLKWSLPRALATMGGRLRAHLDKTSWVPDSGAVSVVDETFERHG